MPYWPLSVNRKHKLNNILVHAAHLNCWPCICQQIFIVVIIMIMNNMLEYNERTPQQNFIIPVFRLAQTLSRTTFLSTNFNPISVCKRSSLVNEPYFQVERNDKPKHFFVAFCKDIRNPSTSPIYQPSPVSLRNVFLLHSICVFVFLLCSVATTWRNVWSFISCLSEQGSQPFSHPVMLCLKWNRGCHHLQAFPMSSFFCFAVDAIAHKVTQQCAYGS